MKATALIKLLADKVAEHGDIDVLLSSGPIGEYRKAHENYIKVAAHFAKSGTRSMYMNEAKARELGGDAWDAGIGLLIG